jgi:hypothetical protein
MRRQPSKRDKKRTAGMAANPAAGDASMAEAKWTVMVLMGANNIADHEQDLSTFADDDLEEMKAVGSKAGVLNIVVQIDQKIEKGGPQRLFIEKGRAVPDDLIPQGEGSSGDQRVLADFLKWAKTKYPAEQYMLVLWGHAYRLAFNRNPKDPDGLDFPILAAVLDETNVGKKLDIVAFDSCNASLVEAAYQLRKTARFLVASQFTDPLPGWPYERILRRALDDPMHEYVGPLGPEDFGRAITSQFVRHYAGSKSVTMTMLDLSRVDEIGDRVQELACALGSALAANQAELARIKAMLGRSQVPDERRGQPAVDLATFCWHLSRDSGDSALRTAAFELGEDLLVLGDPDGKREKKPFIVAHAKSGLLVASLNGVSVFAPSIASGFDSIDLRQKYQALDMSQDTLWDEFVYALVAG